MILFALTVTAQQLELCLSTLRKILQKNRVQSPTCARIKAERTSSATHIRWISSEIATDSVFHKKLTFGWYVNKQNCSTEVMTPLDPQKVTVWYKIKLSRTLEPGLETFWCPNWRMFKWATFAFRNYQLIARSFCKNVQFITSWNPHARKIPYVRIDLCM